MLKTSLVTALFLLPATAAGAADYAISSMKYVKDGAYQAYLDSLTYIDPASGTKCEVKVRNEGKLTPDNLKLNPRSEKETACSTTIPEGAVLWGYVATYVPGLSGPNIENCKKDGVVFRYHSKGGTVTYVTKGTSENKNRCRIKDKGGMLYSSVGGR